MEEHYIMVRAVVGANWGDEGKGKITDMLGQDIPLLTTMVNLHCIHFLQESFTDTPPASLEMVWH